MDERRTPADGPSVEAVQSVFQVTDVRVADDTIYYLGTPLASAKELERELWGLFRDAGYDVSLTTRAQSAASFDETGVVEDRFGPTRPQYVLVAEPRSPHIDGVPWTNLVFFVLTVLSTLLVGTQWYYVEIEGPLSLLEAWPFTAAILGVLAVHEFGHYVMIRYHDVDASLPYFIPFPSLIGTMGAVIRMRGRIPDRKALFDIGVSGPLAGLGATVVVTVIGLHLDPITVPERVLQGSSTSLRFNDPLLLVALAELTGQPLSYSDPTLAANPVIFGGWVGMFVTFLNLLPVGQFDGGHIVRAILGPRQETVAAAVPAVLFGLAGYLYVAQEATNAVVLWAFWGLIAVGLAYAGPATPIRDEPIDRRRKAVGALTLVLGLLCFTPVPFEILAA
ncbi:site-2 protease family protein [Halosimplex salinum]|uniref:site-2 protease family protein n=1 Tax=Halosimplex salinum TaxID=1710538 RepID=UPI000F463902|nr:site-2 protease family protein [Halosimplex salinum]